MDDVKLVVANSIENVVARLGLKVSELSSFQSLLFPLLVPWQDPEHSVDLSVLSFCLKPSSAKIGEPFPRWWEVTLHCYLLVLTYFYCMCVSCSVVFCRSPLLSFCHLAQALRFRRDKG